MPGMSATFVPTLVLDRLRGARCCPIGAVLDACGSLTAGIRLHQAHVSSRRQLAQQRDEQNRATTGEPHHLPRLPFHLP
jgi:hypothetical protein